MELSPGEIWWAAPDPAVGREQSGRRPVLVASSSFHLELVTTLVMTVPLTTTDRGWPNHVRITGTEALSQDSWAMTEQLRTISRARLVQRAGRADPACLAQVRTWLLDHLVD